MFKSSRLIMFLISTICVVFIVSLTRSIYTLWQRGKVVDERALERDQLRAKNLELDEEYKRTQSHEFIEKEAREKLNLQREGEVVVVLPDIKTSQEHPVVSEQMESNWQKWVWLFL